MRKSLWNGFIGVVVSFVAGGVAVAAVPGAHPLLRSNGPTPIISQVTALSIELDDCTGEEMQLVAKGLSPSGESVERTHPLPQSYRHESKPYATFVIDDEDGYKNRIYRIVYTFRDKRYVAGYAAQFGNPAEYDDEWFFTDAELTNVPWQFDTKTQRFQIEAEPSTMPPLPVPFRQKDWKGICFAIPKALKKFTVEKARGEIEARGGRVATTDQEHIDVVLLRDDVDFVLRRNGKAESWMRQGAKVLKERSFQRRVRNEPETAEDFTD